MIPLPGDSIVRFGLFEVDLRGGEIRRDGVKLRLQEQSLQVLTALLERPGEVVTRDELRARLWPDGSFVEFNDGLNHAVARLRQVLDDQAENPRFIQTIPRRGYRLIAPVTVVAEPPSPVPPADAVRIDPPPGGPRRKRSALVPAAAASLALIIGVGAVALMAWITRPEDPRVIRTSRLTTAAGVEHQATWSPDGTRVAYVADTLGRMDVWVRQIAGDAAVPLTADHPGHDVSPAWSPDGAWIAFASERDGGGIDIMSALGGARRRAAHVPFTPSADLAGSVPTLAWSPDGTRLAYAHGVEGRTGLFVVAAAGGDPARVPLPETIRAFSIVEPHWSPDGSRLAFVALSGTLRTSSQIWTIGVDGSRPQSVSDDRSLNQQPVWTRDGRRLFFLSDRRGTRDIYAVHVDRAGRPTGDPVPVTTGTGVAGFALSADGRRLVYSKSEERSNIWSIPLGAPPSLDWSGAAPLIIENHSVEFLELSPDGTWLMFDSTRSGHSELWQIRVDGTGLRQVTGGSFDKFHPTLSPDGTQTAFHALEDGNRDIYTIPIAGGAATRLTDHPAKDWLPRWSPDGRWIAFGSDRSGNQDVFLVPAAGGAARPLAEHPANDHNPLWSPDGHSVLFASNREGADDLYLVPVGGGAARRLTREGWDDIVPLSWRPGGPIFAWARGGGMRVAIWIVSPDDGTAERLLSGDLTSRQLGVSLATDGRRIFMPVWERTSDLWLAELAVGRR